MKKTIIVIIIIGLVIAGGVWWYSSNKKENSNQARINNSDYQYSNYQNSNYQTQKSSTEKNNTEKNVTTVITPKETEIANFSTKIHNKDKERQNNINITCKALSTREVKPGEIFSFCDTVGKATIEKGYKEADIYVEGKKEQGLGGGNCQVSTTLYNAVAQVPGLEVVERHQHSGHVPYIEKGKDAAVAYGNYDLKFKNNTGNVIKIVMENTADNITAKIIKIEK